MVAEPDGIRVSTVNRVIAGSNPVSHPKVMIEYLLKILLGTGRAPLGGRINNEGVTSAIPARVGQW